MDTEAWTLSLALVLKEMVETCIWLRSEEQKGTIFAGLMGEHRHHHQCVN